VADLNARPMKTYGGATRRELFERVDQPLLKPLPQDRFEVSDITTDLHLIQRAESARAGCMS
jgi:hypothetical protein